MRIAQTETCRGTTSSAIAVTDFKLEYKNPKSNRKFKRNRQQRFLPILINPTIPF
jgi:hypothetical protein